MARKPKNTVDYFPHLIKRGYTMKHVLRQYGHKGYACWYMLLEALASTENHFIDLSKKNSARFLADDLLVDESELLEFIQTMVELEQFDESLWIDHRVIWCQKFIENIQDAYKHRSGSCATRNDIVEILENNKPTDKSNKTTRKCNKPTSKSSLSGREQIGNAYIIRDNIIREDTIREDTNRQPPQISLVEPPPPKKKRVAKSEFSLDLIIPDFFDGAKAEDVRIACLQWIDYRKQQKIKTWKELTWRKQFEKFEHDPDALIAAIENSISQGWQGLFAPKGFKNKDQVWAELTEQYGANDL